MYVAYVSHSLVAERQVKFAEELKAQLAVRGHALRQFFPYLWGTHIREGGFIVDDAMRGMEGFTWPRTLFDDWARFVPSVVLVQEEAYCRSTQQVAAWCEANGVPYVTFSWENARPLKLGAEQVLGGAAFNVFGNRAAEVLACASAPVRAVPHVVLPQVGVDTGVFVRRERVYLADLCFAGRREDPMKGFAVLEKAMEGREWLVLDAPSGYVSSLAMSERFSRVRLTVTPSLDVSGRPREQFAPYVNVESGLCETPIVTTRQEAIWEWLQDAPGVFWAKPGDAGDLARVIEEALAVRARDLWKWNATGHALREWMVQRFSNEVVAKAYVDILEKVHGGGGHGVG